ncbi:MAG: hypothetical protein GY711_27785 [bacterium]|nr:hypothetical protein [bacterium]
MSEATLDRQGLAEHFLQEAVYRSREQQASSTTLAGGGGNCGLGDKPAVALDRKRNHFMKDFRHEHGFDRAQYDAEQAAAYRAGLDAVDAEVDAEVDEGRAAAARALLELE